MKALYSILFLLFTVFASNGQVDCGIPGNYCMENGTLNICSGTLFDVGGGGPYTDANLTMTICPDNPGDVISLDFVAFALQTNPNGNQSDYLSIYDGDSTGAPSLGDYTGNSIQGLQVTGTVNNTSGCLTLVFSDNGAPNTTAPGFEALVSCTTPCAPPTGVSAITNPTPDAGGVSVSVCLDTPISFSGAGSSAQPGFTLSQYIWNFDDGTISTDGMNVTHSFSEPGEYIVSLTVEDNNGCQSLNLIPLQVLVSTIPTFEGLQSETTCFGETIELTGTSQSTTWTALPPQVVAGETYLADGAGFSYSTSLVFDFFEEGAILEDCSDLYSILVNMEHSFMGDLGLFITCPDGTSVDLVTWGTNGGGGTFLGEAVDDGTNAPGVGYDYFWAPDATNGTWGENAGVANILPSGTYEASEDLCDLVGCPLNGAWTFNVTDNLAIDNGYIFYWGINFNPALFPGITTFTPSIGADADSSYWTGPNITSFDADADVITITPPGPGSYDYTYHVVNSFGCGFDTTITITFEQAMAIAAGPDQLYSCGAVQLEGSFEDLPAASCSEDAGVFDYCYSNGDNFTWTFCPDDQGDGVTFMTFTFISGQMEGFFEDFIVYDGPNTSSPILESWIQGDATGLSWTATNASGCLTIQFSADGSIACGSGNYQPWTYEISCSNGGPQYTWEWEPAQFLDNPNVPQPNVVDLPQTTTFTLTGYPVGHPACATTDEVLVSIDPLGDPGLSNTIQICSTDAPFEMFDELLGTPVTTGEWTDPGGAVMVSGSYDPMVNEPGVYTYTVAFANCETFSELTINQALPTEIVIADDTSMCYLGDLNMELIALQFGQAPFTYEWTYNGTPLSGAENASFNPELSGVACLEVIDACGYSIQECFNVFVEPNIIVEFEADTTEACWPEPFNLVILTDSSLYQNSTWQISDGTTLQNQPEYTHLFDSPGIYDVSLLLISPLGCNYSLELPDYLTSWNPPVAQFTLSPYPTDANDTYIFFQDASEGSIAEWQWLFNYPNILGFSTEQNPEFWFPIGTGGEYPIQLTVTDVNNCTDVLLSPIIINDIFQYYIPNAFTPNNDGINDVFRFYGADIDENRFLLQVFNRWGDILFETTDPNVPWLGDYRDSGEYFGQNEVYLWRAKVASKSTGERKEFEGHVTLIR
ncbi:MAG: PKD domain-containing protein [Flavobacteriales bacterium]